MKQYKELVLKTKNLKTKIEKDIEPFLTKLSHAQYVEGIALLGGLGLRNYLDKYSDLDMAIFYKTNTPAKYFLPFEFHITINNYEYEFNIHQLFFDDEISKTWDESKKEAYQRTKIVIDKKNRITKLIKAKTKYDNKTAYNRLIWIIQQYIWRGHVHSIRTYMRGYPEGSHDLLNECADLLIESIYILNKRFRPHKKWRLAMLPTMEILPKNIIINLKEALLVKNYSIKDIKRRIIYLDKIYRAVYNIVKIQYPQFPDNPYEYYYKNFVQLNKNTYIQKLVSKYGNKLSDKKKEQLKGELCFNLICSLPEAKIPYFKKYGIINP